MAGFFAALSHLTENLMEYKKNSTKICQLDHFQNIDHNFSQGHSEFQERQAPNFDYVLNIVYFKKFFLLIIFLLLFQNELTN